MTPDLVQFARDGVFGFIKISHPPVNALSTKVVQALSDALSAFEQDLELSALVLWGDGRTWVAGADLTELEDEGFPVRQFNAFLARLEQQSRPVIASLHGTVLGGGLELAMACHHRVARRDTRFGMPEVTVGIIPGSLGTQRLPRLIGAELALDLIMSGQMINAQKAITSSLIDEVGEGDARANGIAAAQSLLKLGAPLRRSSLLPVVPASEDVFSRARESAGNKRGWPQLAAAVRCVYAAQTVPFIKGEALEMVEFSSLVNSSTAKALRHLFFAKRDAAKVPGLSDNTALFPLKSVGVVGAGTMGAGIAMNFINAGLPTVIVDITQEALDRGLGHVRETYEASVAKGRLSGEEIGRRLGLLSSSLTYDALSDCDLVIEAVFENLDLKKSVCLKIGAVAKPGAIIATNTSTLDIDELASASGRPDSVVGMHFFSPAHVMRLLEVVRGARTSPEVLASTIKLAARIGKVPVVAGVCYGFIGNRMAEVYMRETEFLIMEGAEPSQIDSVMEGLGFAMGPCRMLDMAGVDVGALTVIERGKAGGLPPDPSYRALVRRLHELGRHGQKTGAGFYRYEGRVAKPDPLLTQIAFSLAREHGIERRDSIEPKEILERLLCPLINEGFKILEEGIAYRPGDIDVVWVAGYGFPDFTGGPMWMANAIGLDHIAERIEHHASRTGNPFGYWTAAKSLVDRYIVNKNE